MAITKQKIGLIVGSSLLSAYLAIFIYQRIQRAKADASVVSEKEALEKLNEKSDVKPVFTEEDTIPLIPEESSSSNEYYSGYYVYSNDLASLQLFETQSGFGDF